ncbi:MAG TPA: acyl-CoA dehydrogenase family protein, partial [Dehalococcoidia bacterium]|nr:acyl-CoA dehydrogenase family protein [Dehalococcoidia bacterium]
MTTTAMRTEQDVLAAVERIRPIIEAHRDEGERERRLSKEVVAAMQREGFFDLWLPAEYGGAEVDLPTYLRAVEALAEIDSAAGWTLANSGTAAVQAAFLPEAGAREVFGNRVFTAGSVTPRGRAVPVDGGYRVSGQWPLASGAHHAEWIGGCCMVFDGDAPRMAHGMPDFKLMFFPASDCKVLDTWHSSGMRATDSTDFAVEDAFVPEARTFSLFTAESRLQAPIYRMRIEMHFFTALPTVSLGVARSAIDTFVELAKQKTPTLSQTGLAVRPTIHAEVAKAEALYQSARAYLYEVAREIADAVATGPGVPEELEARRRLACVNLGEACCKVVDMMYKLGGSSSIYSGQRLDRCLRDMHTLNQHLAVSPVW